MLRGRLRFRIAAILCAIALPIACIASIWAWSYNKELRSFKRSVAVQSAFVIASEVDGALQDIELLGSLALARFAVDKQQGCSQILDAVLKRDPRYEGAAIFDASQSECVVGRLKDSLVTSEILQSWLSSVLKSQARTVILSPEVDGRVLLVVNKSFGSDTNERFLLFASRDLIASTLKPPPGMFPSGIAVLDAENHVVVSRTITENVQSTLATDGWLTKLSFDREMPAFFTERFNDGTLYAYSHVPLKSVDASLLVGYPATRLFQAEDQQFWRIITTPFVMLAILIMSAVLAVDKLVVRWVIYLRRITQAYGAGHFSVRILRLENAPVEIAELASSFNTMANHVAQNAAALKGAVEEKDRFLRELHHRVKNNLQVIASLLSLHKQTLSVDRRDEIRFIEEHVQAMAVVYRLVYASNDMTKVTVADLVPDLCGVLRQAANLTPSAIKFQMPYREASIELDLAIALGLYLAAVLPPYLDAAQLDQKPVFVGLEKAGDAMELSISGDFPEVQDLGFLRERLIKAYIRQLNAEVVSKAESGRTILIRDQKIVNT